MNSDTNWAPISDLMSALMMIFLFISITYMLNVNKEKSKIEDIVITYNKLQVDLYQDLFNEFEKDLTKWNATIDKERLSISFESPDIYFEIGSSEINTIFSNVLLDFWPRYVSILLKDKYKDDIEEIRIEGHTSSEWHTTASKERAYLLNMELSQERARSVLGFVLLNAYKFDMLDNDWIISNVTANGLSSSKLVVVNDKEDKELSRRVEFRVRTNAEQRVVKIIEEVTK